jgi:predicted PurR-regulated permease PerM
MTDSFSAELAKENVPGSPHSYAAGHPLPASAAIRFGSTPVIENFEPNFRRGWNRTVAALGIVGLFVIGVGGVLVLVTPLLGMEVADFIEKFPQYIGKLQAFANNPGRPWLRKIIGEGLSEAEQSANQLSSVAADWIPTFLRSLWSDSRALLSLFSLIASRVQVNPVWIMFAIAAFGYLFGFVGLLIAVPLATAIGVVIRFAIRQHLFNPPEAAE